MKYSKKIEEKIFSNFKSKSYRKGLIDMASKTTKNMTPYELTLKNYELEYISSIFKTMKYPEHKSPTSKQQNMTT